MFNQYSNLEKLRQIMPDANEYNVNRINKVIDIESQGVNPYPYSFNKKNFIRDIPENITENNNAEHYTVAGRIMQIRNMGKSVFMNLKDQTGSIQLYLNTRHTTVEFNIFNLNVGDIIGVTGTVFRTKTGEKTLRIKGLTLLTKSIRPLPEKYHGIKNPEFRQRYRSLDMIMNDKVRDRFINRSRAISAIREFLISRNYCEVDTPILDTKYGGGEAEPFVTYLNALKTDVYLAVSPELYLKRYIVGGIERVFTFSRAFRNEGIDRTHYPEFTLLECYQAYADYQDMMELMEQMYDYVFKKVIGTTKVTVNGLEIDFKAPWDKKTMYELVNSEFNFNLNDMSQKELQSLILARKINIDLGLVESEVQSGSKGILVQHLFEKYCEAKIIRPTFVLDHPYETSPLCKKHRDNQELIERFEPFVLGIELGNAYSELNNPLKQRELLQDQSAQFRAGSETAFPMDEEFARAIDIGMPPTGGLGVGIDRLIMFLTGADSIKEVIAFPIMK